MAFKALDVAKYVVDYCTKQNKSISNLKLQKMLYFLWIDYYKITKEYLFEENIYAWPFGPVISDVYYEYCSYAGNPITKTYDDVVEIFNNEILLEINNIIDKYINYTANQLVNISHKFGFPWDIVYNNGSGYKSIIPFDLIIQVEC